MRFLYKWAQKNWVERKFRTDEFYNRIQADLNKIYEPIKINISKRYAQIITIMHVSLLYSPILPIAVPIGVCGGDFRVLVYHDDAHKVPCQP